MLYAVSNFVQLRSVVDPYSRLFDIKANLLQLLDDVKMNFVVILSHIRKKFLVHILIFINS